MGIKYAIPSIHRFLWGNDSLACTVSEHAFASSPNLRGTAQEAQVKTDLWKTVAPRLCGGQRKALQPNAENGGR